MVFIPRFLRHLASFLQPRYELSLNRAVMMGLMLHENSKNLIRRQLYKDALEVLTMGEVSSEHPPTFTSTLYFLHIFSCLHPDS